ncbi:MAG: hypothetical protein V8R52_13080 [Coprobacter fastidiosus]
MPAVVSTLPVYSAAKALAAVSRTAIDAPAKSVFFITLFPQLMWF